MSVFLLYIFLLLSFLFNCKEKTGTDISQDNLKYKGKKLNFLVTTPQSKTAYYLADKFNKETGAVIQINEIGYDETLEKILNDHKSKNSQFDIMMIWYPNLGDLVENNTLLDLTEWIDKNKDSIQPDDFIPGIYKAYTLYKGKRWALPFDGDTHVLYYRKSIFNKYNLSPPKTWEEFSYINQMITEKESINGVYGSAIMCHKIPVLIISSFLNRVGGYGGTLFKNNKPSLNTKENINALKQLVIQTKYALPSPTETNFEVSRDAFISGRVAMVEQWTDIGIMAEDPSESTIIGDWGAVQMPSSENSPENYSPALNAGYSLGISSKTNNQELAKDFLKFIIKKENMAEYNFINGGVDPTRISILESKEFKKFAPEIYRATQTAIKNSTAWPNLPKTSQLLNILSENLISAIEKRKSPEEALNDTQKKWNKILDIKE